MAKLSNERERFLAFLRKAKLWKKKTNVVPTRLRSKSAPVKILSDDTSPERRVRALALLPPVNLGATFDEAVLFSGFFSQSVGPQLPAIDEADWSIDDKSKELADSQDQEGLQRGRNRRSRAATSVALPQNRWSLPILQGRSLAVPKLAPMPLQAASKSQIVASEEPGAIKVEQQGYQTQIEQVQRLVHRPVEEVNAVLRHLKAVQEKDEAAAKKARIALKLNKMANSDSSQAQPYPLQAEASAAKDVSPASQQVEPSTEVSTDQITPRPELPSSASSQYSKSISGTSTGAVVPSDSTLPDTSHEQSPSPSLGNDSSPPNVGMVFELRGTKPKRQRPSRIPVRSQTSKTQDSSSSSSSSTKKLSDISPVDTGPNAAFGIKGTSTRASLPPHLPPLDTSHGQGSSSSTNKHISPEKRESSVLSGTKGKMKATSRSASPPPVPPRNPARLQKASSSNPLRVNPVEAKDDDESDSGVSAGTPEEVEPAATAVQYTEKDATPKAKRTTYT